ncbi:MAG: hypothetical protein HRT94_05840 [Alphaproteobacteria bacterium]|nr:hypothetical protein [Alphaproteobacteria bacterium]
MKTIQGSTLRFSRVIASFMLLLAFLCQPVAAKMLNLDEIVDIAPVTPIPLEEFDAKTELVEEVPFGDESLAFSMRLPNGWVSNVKAPVDLLLRDDESSLLGIVASYVSPAKDHMRSYFTVESLELKYNILTTQWFSNYVVSQGYSMEAVTVHSDEKVEAFYVDVSGDYSYAVRILAQRNGARMILKRYGIPLQWFKDEQVMQAQVLSSFKLKNPTSDNVEEMKEYGFLSESYFDYPETWELIPSKIKSVNRMKATLIQDTTNAIRRRSDNKINALDGQMTMYVTSRYEKTTLKKEVQLFKDKLDIPDYTLGNFIEKREMKYHDDMAFGATEVYELVSERSTKVDYELWVSVMYGDDYYYIVSLLTPTRESNFYKWARNTEAYKYVIASVRQYDDEGLYILE